MKNLDLEKKVLSMLLMDTDLLLESELTEDDFSWVLHKKFFQLIKQYWANLERIVEKFAPDDKDYAYEVFTVALSTSSFVDDVTHLKELTELRRIHALARGIQIAIADGAELSKIQEKIPEFEQEKIVKADIHSVIQEIVEETTGTREVIQYPSGYVTVDKYLWGFRPWQLVVIWARPAVGKTMFAINLLLNQVEHKTKAVFFSLEMTNKSITQRILSRSSKIPVRALMGTLTPEQLNVMNVALEWFTEYLKDLTLIDTAFTISEIVRQITYLKKKEGLQIAYIDYLGLIRGQGQNRNYEIGNITRELKLLAMKLDIPIILLAQLNRGTENRGWGIPQLSDLRDSGSIEQDADIVLLLHRDVENAPRELSVFARKNRNWPIWEIELICEASSMQIGEKRASF